MKNDFAEWVEHFKQEHGRAPLPGAISFIDRATEIFESYGREDAALGRPALLRAAFGQLAAATPFKNADVEGRQLMADLMQICYMDGYASAENCR